MSGQRFDSAGGAGTSESGVAAGCSLSERLRPKIRKSPDLDGLAVFSWGRGEDGQLGLGDTSDQDEPTYVDCLRGVGVRQIACGSGHTVVLTTDGEVYTWGKSGSLRCVALRVACLLAWLSVCLSARLSESTSLIHINRTSNINIRRSW
jgi:alpha-tubulin suppressor-like RCC1 family protein